MRRNAAVRSAERAHSVEPPDLGSSARRVPGAVAMTVMDELHSDLEPVVTELFDRHLANAKEWFPHEFVPWSRGRDFGTDAPWDPDETPVAEPARAALMVNLLTEDNLPYYYASLSVDQRSRDS